MAQCIELPSAGTAIWVTFLTIFGDVLGKNHSAVEQHISPLSKIALGIVSVALIFFLVRKQLSKPQS